MAYKIAFKLGISAKCSADSSLLGKKKHGVEWYNGAYISKKSTKPQGRWSKADIAFATEVANTLPKNKGGYFDFPENSTSIVYMPGGKEVRATKFWLKNNGITWYGYPLP